jgi:hypothetical protein
MVAWLEIWLVCRLVKIWIFFCFFAGFGFSFVSLLV